MSTNVKGNLRVLSSYAKRLGNILKALNEFDLESSGENAYVALCDQLRATKAELSRSFDRVEEELLLAEGLDETSAGTLENLRTQIDDLNLKLAAKLPVDIEISIPSLQCVDNSLDSGRRSRETRAKLPTIHLPKFSGNILEYKSFIDLFKSLIEDEDSMPYPTRIVYLKTCLEGEALKCVTGVPLSEEGYKLALNALDDRYDNHRLYVSKLLDIIIDLPQLSFVDCVSMRKFLSAFEESRRLLSSHYNVDEWGPLLVAIVLRKFNSELRAYFEERIVSKEFPSIDSIITLLENRCLSLEAAPSETGTGKTSQFKSTSSNFKSFPNQGSRGSHSINPSQSRSMALVAGTSSNTNPCSLCRGTNHGSFKKCPIFRSLEPNKRYEVVKNHKLCLMCLAPNHLVSQCPSTSNCSYCDRRHNSDLCFSQEARPTGLPSQATTIANTSLAPAEDNLECVTNRERLSSSCSNVATSFSTAFANSGGAGFAHSLLATARVTLDNGHGERCTARALLDLGAQTSFLTERLAHRLKLPLTPVQHRVMGVSGSITAVCRNKASCSIVITGKPVVRIPIECLLLPKVADDLPVEPVDKTLWKNVDQRKLADPTFHLPGPVNLILGADILPELMKDGFQRGKTGALSTLNTRLGLVVFGKMGEVSENSSYCHIAQFVSQDETENLNSLVERFWEFIEPPNSNLLSPDDEFCEQHFLSTVKRLENSKLEVELPFRQTPVLGNSRSIAERRLLSLERRLQKHPDTKVAYHKVMKDYLSKGYMVLATRLPAVPSFYMPHHCVLRPGAPLSKLRIVFNASSVTGNGESLNSLMLPGPKLQPNLSTLLMRFRVSPIAFVCDISKMYLQIQIPSHQWDLQRCLWRFDPNDPIQEYWLVTLTFGEAAAPYLAQRVIKLIADDCKELQPDVHKLLTGHTFMDDILGNSSSVEEAICTVSRLSDILSAAGFHLHKWASNSPALLETVNNPNSNESVDFENDPESVKVLGVQWVPGSDHFSYSITVPSSHLCSKRSILSFIAKTFDPLGWLTPVLLIPKLWVQDLWKRNLGWDDEVSDPLPGLWNQYILEFNELASFSLPRCIKTFGSPLYSLMAFCDASESAYGAVVYLKETDSDSGAVRVHLLMAKGRVTPLKPITLARLELCSAVLLRDLLHDVITALDGEIEIASCHAWSDSTNTLFWVTSHPSKWKTFVSNRVAYIQEVIPQSYWRYVATGDNPADSLTRGLRPNEFLLDKLYLNGPTWLSLPESEWPSPTFQDRERSQEVVSSEKPFQIHSFSFLATSNDPLNVESRLKYPIERIAKWTWLVRIIAHCFRFFRRLKYKIPIPSFPPAREELEEAEIVYLRHIQYHNLNAVIVEAAHDDSVHPLVRSLNLKVDSQGVLRVNGRLVLSELPRDFRRPVLLPPKHLVTNLIIDCLHLRTLHAGTNTVLALLQSKYWISNGRQVVRSRLRRCVKCFRANPKPASQQMAPLPKARISLQFPFLRIGLDFAGPFETTSQRARGSIVSKSYVCVIVCMATKAVHLEVVSNLSTQAFLAAFHRFTSRRGLCTEVYSDNGRNFVGANKELKEIFDLVMSEDTQRTVLTRYAHCPLRWHFNPPAAPSMGGLWEAAVKSFKVHLRKIGHLGPLSFEEFQTVLNQIEATLNSRPLTPASSDPRDMDVLTPGHFLIGRPLVALPDRISSPIDYVPPTKRWLILQRAYRTFWGRWQSEYLSTLQRRPLKDSKPTHFEVGQLVMLKEDNIGPLLWPRGRILELCPGRDGLTRVVRLRTVSGEYTRPITRLCPLPISC